MTLKQKLIFLEYVRTHHNKREFFTRKALRLFFLNYKTTRQLEQARRNGVTQSAFEKSAQTAQDRCNHLKGGYGAEAVVYGKGGSPYHGAVQYAVTDHTFANGDRWISCLRCRKRWKPGNPGYEEALKFPTNNTPSSSITFQGQGFTERHRHATENS
jgi:hypothetical protein